MFQIHMWARGYDQGEVSLVHTNIKSLSLSLNNFIVHKINGLLKSLCGGIIQIGHTKPKFWIVWAEVIE